MHEVLISYSKKDKKWADAACSVLEAHGIRCWIAPRDIVPGTEWGAAIIAGIDGCKVIVVIFSASANESPQVRREVERAISKGLTVVPCRVEDVKPVGAMEYALGNTHWLDVFTPPVERQMNLLAESVEALLARGGGASNVAGNPSLASHPTSRTESLREKGVPIRNWRGNKRLVLTAGFTLLFLLAVSLLFVLWPRKEAASTPAEPTLAALDGFVPLFNGKDLSGWTTLQNQPRNWHVQDGVLIGFGTDASDLYSMRDDFRDFHIRVEARISDRGNSGILFRFGGQGYEAQINSTHPRDPTRTGSLYADGKCVVNFPEAPPPDRWFTEEVIAKGKHIVIKVDGQKTADFLDGRHQKGRIGLQHRREPTLVEFRKIEVKELTPQ